MVNKTYKHWNKGKIQFLENVNGLYTNLIDVKHIKGIINKFRPINLDEMDKSFPLFFFLLLLLVVLGVRIYIWVDDLL